MIEYSNRLLKKKNKALNFFAGNLFVNQVVYVTFWKISNTFIFGNHNVKFVRESSSILEQ